MLEVGAHTGSSMQSPASTPRSHLYFKRRLGGGLTSSRFSFSAPLHTKPNRGSAAAKRGLRFESRVLAAFAARYGCRFVPQLSLSFQTNSKVGRAILDGLLLSQCGRKLCIVEVKLSHCVDVFYQVQKFYLPILEDATRGAFERIVFLEVCRNFDPWVKCPLEPRIISSPDDAFEASEGVLPVIVTRDGEL